MKRTNTATWSDKYSRWQINVQKNGKRRSFYSSTPGRAGQRECNHKADEWLDEGIQNSRCHIGELATSYIEQLKLTTSKSHWRQYEGYFNNWILPELSPNMRIEDLTEQKMQNVINKAYSKGGLSKKTLGNLRACMLNFLKYCRKSKVTTLFVEGLEIPKRAVSKSKTVLQADDLRRLFDIDTSTDHGKIVKEIYINAYRFEVLTGLRPGEICGLKNKDIEENIVTLQRAINFYNEVTDGKNENARRTFQLTPLAVEVLESQKKLAKDMGISSEFVFFDRYGDPIKQINYYKHWVKYCENAGISKITPYELRHTFVSISKSLPEGYLRQLVGHSKDMDTYGIYSHELQDDRAEAAVLLQNIFAKLLVPKNDISA